MNLCKYIFNSIMTFAVILLIILSPTASVLAETCKFDTGEYIWREKGTIYSLTDDKRQASLTENGTFYVNKKNNNKENKKSDSNEYNISGNSIAVFSFSPLTGLFDDTSLRLFVSIEYFKGKATKEDCNINGSWQCKIVGVNNYFPNNMFQNIEEAKSFANLLLCVDKIISFHFNLSKNGDKGDFIIGSIKDSKSAEQLNVVSDGSFEKRRTIKEISIIKE